jgi:hypothetical protein
MVRMLVRMLVVPCPSTHTVHHILSASAYSDGGVCMLLVPVLLTAMLLLVYTLCVVMLVSLVSMHSYHHRSTHAVPHST